MVYPMAQPNISNLQHNLPASLLPSTTYTFKIWGATTSSGKPIVYNIANGSKYLIFSKISDISENETLSVTTSNINLPTVTAGFDVVARDTGGTSIYEITTPYTASDLEALNYVQSADIIYLAHKNFPPKKLMRFSDTNWQLQDITFRPTIGAPPKPTITVKGSSPASGKVTNFYKVSVIDATTGDESYPSPESSLETEALTQTYYNELSVPELANVAEYRFYKRKGGSYGYIGSAQEGSFEDRNIGADTSDTPIREKVPFAAAGDYPGIVFLWQQRLGWASTTNKPLSIWMSRSGNYENLASSQPPKDDDGIEVTLASSGQNKIQWINGEQVLVMGTSAAEYTITGADSSPVLTPTSISFSKQSNYGSNSLNSLAAGGNLLFSQRGTGDFREFSYNFQKDRYVSPSMILLATHLIQDKQLLRWVWQSSENILWVVCEDGTLAACTYMPDHEIIGWHHHTTEGLYIDASVIPGKKRDKLFVLVKRIINGIARTYLEVMEDPFVGDDLNKAFFVDSGLSYTGAPVESIQGMNHLEGKKVAIFADGATMAARFVKDGSVELDYPVSNIHVGLPFSSEVMPNRPEVATQQGTSLTRKISIVQAAVKFYRSMNVQIGQEGGKMIDALMHDVSDPLKPAFASEELDKVVNTGWDRDKCLRFVVDDPVPMTIVCVVYGMRMAPQI